MKPTLREANSVCWQDLGAELVFSQDCSGKYLSFYWQAAVDYGLSNQQVVGRYHWETLVPVARSAYDERIRRILERRIPEQCHCWLKYGGNYFPFELVVSPILPRSGKPTKVLVIGHRLEETEISLTSNSALPVNPDPYQKLLTKIAQEIRRTLDLETIWQQTVKYIGDALAVSRCNILQYNKSRKQLKVKAKYCQERYKSILGKKLDVESEDYLKQAIYSRELVLVDRIAPDSFPQKSVMLVSTFYQKDRNGIIWLGQCDRYRQWTQGEIELVQELADQVGTAIAHATLYKELEQARNEAEDASRMKSDFLASTTHELRTPLNGIIGFIQLVLDGMADDPEEQREFLEQAHNSALYLLNLINDILDLAKIEAGKIDLQLAPVELNGLLKNVEKKTAPQAKAKNISFKIKLPLTYDQVILYADPHRLLQVLLNLVSNAIKFTPKGGVTITVEVVQKKIQRQDLEEIRGPVREFPGMVKINVADTGIGVPLDQQKNLFENFFQVDGGRTREFGGTGLGLAISQKLVKAMGGKIFFYSMGEGLGSTVSFNIPLNHAPVMKTVEIES